MATYDIFLYPTQESQVLGLQHDSSFITDMQLQDISYTK